MDDDGVRNLVSTREPSVAPLCLLDGVQELANRAVGVGVSRDPEPRAIEPSHVVSELFRIVEGDAVVSGQQVGLND
jgi:hypothetical protein